MNKNTWVTAIVVAVVFGGGGFYAGMQYQSSQSPAARFAGGAAGAGNFAGRGAGAGAAGRFAGGANGGFSAGTIISTGSGSITIQLAASTSTASGSNGSKIVLVDNNTQITKTTSGAQSDLAPGTNVTVSGTPNADGSITATMIAIRPADMGPRGGAPTPQQ